MKYNLRNIMLQASELFAKAAGAFIHTKGEGGTLFGESEGTDVVIYLPEIQNISDCEVSDGED